MLKLLGRQVQIDLGLAAARHSVQQHGLALRESFANVLQRNLLVKRQFAEDGIRMIRFGGFFLPGGARLRRIQHQLLEAGVVSGPEHLARRAKVVIGNGAPQRQLAQRSRRSRQYVIHRLDGRQVHAHGSAVPDLQHNSQRGMPAQGHLHPRPGSYLPSGRQPIRQRILQLQRQQHLDISLLLSHNRCYSNILLRN